MDVCTKLFSGCIIPHKKRKMLECLAELKTLPEIRWDYQALRCPILTPFYSALFCVRNFDNSDGKLNVQTAKPQYLFSFAVGFIQYRVWKRRQKERKLCKQWQSDRKEIQDILLFSLCFTENWTRENFCDVFKFLNKRNTSLDKVTHCLTIVTQTVNHLEPWARKLFGCHLWHFEHEAAMIGRFQSVAQLCPGLCAGLIKIIIFSRSSVL